MNFRNFLFLTILIFTLGASHVFADQLEPWINHTGDRLFFQSDMDNYSENGENDLYMMELTMTLTTDQSNENKTKLYIHPNPVNDYADIKSLTQPSNYRYHFNSISEMVVLDGILDGDTIHCPSLPSGVYVLSIYSERDHYNIKLIKK